MSVFSSGRIFSAVVNDEHAHNKSMQSLTSWLEGKLECKKLRLSHCYHRKRRRVEIFMIMVYNIELRERQIGICRTES